MGRHKHDALLMTACLLGAIAFYSLIQAEPSGMAAEPPASAKPVAFKPDYSQARNVCWKNNGCYSFKKGYTYRCNAQGFKNEYGEFVCHCDPNCNVRMDFYK